MLIPLELNIASESVYASASYKDFEQCIETKNQLGSNMIDYSIIWRALSS